MATGQETTVEARFSPTGEIFPLRFTWRGSTLSVESVGRCRREGGRRRFVVLAAGGRPFELRLDEKTLCWRIYRSSASRAVA